MALYTGCVNNKGHQMTIDDDMWFREIQSLYDHDHKRPSNTLELRHLPSMKLARSLNYRWSLRSGRPLTFAPALVGMGDADVSLKYLTTEQLALWYWVVRKGDSGIAAFVCLYAREKLMQEFYHEMVKRQITPASAEWANAGKTPWFDPSTPEDKLQFTSAYTDIQMERKRVGPIRLPPLPPLLSVSTPEEKTIPQQIPPATGGHFQPPPSSSSSVPPPPPPPQSKQEETIIIVNSASNTAGTQIDDLPPAVELRDEDLMG
jgi:hypothetical protein